MQAHGHKSEQLITCASHEELQLKWASHILLILIKRAFTKLQRVSKRPHMKMTFGIHKMNPHRRQVRAFSVLLGRIVRRKKSGKDHNRVERHKKNDPTRDGALPFQVPASVRIRGSAQ